MHLFTALQKKQWEQYTITHEPVTGADLMERAGIAFIEAFCKLNPACFQKTIYIFCGSGNNGGDGYVIARLLHEMGIQVFVYAVPTGTPTDENTIQRKRLQTQTPVPVNEWTQEPYPQFEDNAVIIDAILGNGINRPLKHALAGLINYLNSLEATRISVDVPCGMFTDMDQWNLQGMTTVFRAYHTITFEVPPATFMLEEAYEFTGEISIVPIGLMAGYPMPAEGHYYMITDEWAGSVSKERHRVSHKGTYGHALLAGGSYGKAGAMVLAAGAALRAGCGLVTAYVPKVAYTIMQTALPEAMVQTADDINDLRNFDPRGNFSAVGVGPGMGVHPLTVKAFGQWIMHLHLPLLIDADGLNACAELLKHNKEFAFPPGCILTPHRKEFERLAGASVNEIERLEMLRSFAMQHNIIVVLKGAHTAIAMPGGDVYFNNTGNALLATAGSGDVLSGIITSLLAQGYEPSTAARLGVYMHGKLADNLKALGHKRIIAGDLVEALKWL